MPTPLITLVRHAESAANAGLVTDDPALIPLTERGCRQAEEFSRTIEQAPGLIVTSPFERAIETARPTLDRHPGTPHQIWDIGEFTYLAPQSCVGTSVAERKTRVITYWENADPDYVDGDGAESFRMFFSRAQSALDALDSVDFPVLVVGHGQVMQAMRWMRLFKVQDINQMLMREFRQYDLANPISNCGVILLYTHN